MWLSFGHISFMAIGAYTAGLLTISPLMKLAVMSQLPDFIEHAHWGSAPAVIMGGVVAAVFATVVSIPLMRLSGLAASLATFAVLNIVFIVSDNWTQVTNGSAGIADIPTATTALGATAWALLVVCVAFAFQATRSGLRLRASREDDVAAQSIGIMIVHERRVSFVLSAFIGGIGGGVFAQFIGSFNAQSFYLSLTFLTFVMLVVGGTRSLAGAVIGSLFISLVSAVLVRVESGVSLGLVEIPARPGLREVALALIMLATLILRPSGITGGREIPALSSIPAGSFIDRFRAHRKLSSAYERRGRTMQRLVATARRSNRRRRGHIRPNNQSRRCLVLRADGKRHKQTRWFVGVVLGLVLLLVGCGGDDNDSGDSGNADTSSTPAASDDKLIIGLATAHSSFQAPIDAPAEAAVRLAGEDYNGEGGILDRQISFIQADTKSDPAQSANAAVQLLDKGAQVLVVTCDYDTGGPRLASLKKRTSLRYRSAPAHRSGTRSGRCIQHDLRISHRRCGRRAVGAQRKARVQDGVPVDRHTD